MMDKTLEMISEYEARALVEQKFTRYSIDQYCSKEQGTFQTQIPYKNLFLAGQKFIKSHKKLISRFGNFPLPLKINQAHKNAITGTDDYIKDILTVSQNKIKDLIYNLLVSQSWKMKVYPIIRQDLAKLPSFKSYLAIHHQATICNLLQCICFYPQVFQAAQDATIELIDYCYRKLMHLRDGKVKYIQPTIDAKKTATTLQQTQISNGNIEFNISCMAISIISSICMNLDVLSVPVVHQLLENNDIIILLADIMDQRCWIRFNQQGEKEKFEEQKWVKVEKKDIHKVTKLQGQIWVALLTVIYSQNPQKRYEITEFRKSVLLKLRKYLNEIVTDQIPALRNLQRTLEELNIMQCPATPSVNSFIVQQVPEYRDSILKGKDWTAIAKYQIENFFKDDPKSRQEQAQRILNIYNSDVLEQFLQNPKCGNCGQGAEQRCSRCKNQWYCSRDCQVKAWKVHKPICKIFAEAKKNQEADKKQHKQKNEIIQQVEQTQPSKTLIEELD